MDLLASVIDERGGTSGGARRGGLATGVDAGWHQRPGFGFAASGPWHPGELRTPGKAVAV